MFPFLFRSILFIWLVAICNQRMALTFIRMIMQDTHIHAQTYL